MAKRVGKPTRSSVPSRDPAPSRTTTTTRDAAPGTLGYFGALDVGYSGSTLADRMAIEYAAGLRIVGYQTGWDRHEKPTENTWSSGDATTYQDHITAIKNAGMKIVLEVGFNFPPSFYKTTPYSDGTFRFVDQFGNSSAHANGSENGAAWSMDFIWQAAARDKIERYIRKLHEYVPFSDPGIVGVRVGGSYATELLFPHETAGGTTGSYWGYGTAAQTGTGLATGTVNGIARNAAVCPLPGWVPGDTNATDAQTWYEWYLDSLVEAHNWLIDLYRSLGFAGQIWAVMPGLGARPSQVSASYTAKLVSNQSVMAVGAAWHLVHDRLKSSGRGYGSWCSSAAEDASTDITQAGDKDLGSENESWSSMRRMAYLADRRGLVKGGENPGGTPTGYGLTMLRQLVRQADIADYLHTLWAHDHNLHDGTGGSNGGAVSVAGYIAEVAAL